MPLLDAPSPPLTTTPHDTKWAVDKDFGESDESGWSYAVDFAPGTLDANNVSGAPEMGKIHFVRRRRWARLRRKRQADSAQHLYVTCTRWPPIKLHRLNRPFLSLLFVDDASEHNSKWPGYGEEQSEQSDSASGDASADGKRQTKATERDPPAKGGKVAASATVGATIWDEAPRISRSESLREESADIDDFDDAEEEDLESFESKKFELGDPDAKQGFCIIEPSFCKVRGKTYLDDRLKVAPGSTVGDVISFEMFRDDKKRFHCSADKDRRTAVAAARKNGDTREMFVINVSLTHSMEGRSLGQL